MQPLQEEPGESAEVEEMQQDGDDCAHKLQSEYRMIKTLGALRAGGKRRETRTKALTGLSAWLMPRMKMSSERKRAVAPLLIMLVLLHCMALRQSRKIAVRKRKPSVTPAVLHVRILMGRISPFWCI